VTVAFDTGKLPWSDKNYHQMIHTVAVKNERPPMTPDIPRELANIIEKSWWVVEEEEVVAGAAAAEEEWH